MGYLSLIVLLPLAGVLWRSTNGGMSAFWTAISTPDAVSALQFTVFASLATAAIEVTRLGLQADQTVYVSLDRGRVFENGSRDSA